MNIAVILGLAKYNVMRYFTGYFKEEFERLGHKTFVWDIGRYIDWPYGGEKIDLIFAINGHGIGANEDENDYKKIPGYDRNTVIVWYMLDHPVYLYPRLRRTIPNRLVFYMDESFAAFTTDVLRCPIAADGFLPHAGVRCQPKAGRPRRDIDFLLTSTAFDQPHREVVPERMKAVLLNIKEIPFPDTESLLSFFNDTLDVLLGPPNHLSIWEGIVEAARGRYETAGWSVDFSHMFTVFVDQYMYAHRKYALLDFVLKNDLRVHVYGEGWAEHRLAARLDGGKQPVDFLDLLKLYARSKFVLHSNGNLSHGSHERVFNALINSAIPLISDGSSYYEQVIPGLYLTLKDTERLNRLLTDENYFNRLSEQAVSLVSRRHTWPERARQVIRYVNDYRELLNMR